jgi:hypothetical protein
MTTANDKSRRQAASRKRYRRLDELAAHKKWLEAAEPDADGTIVLTDDLKNDLKLGPGVREQLIADMTAEMANIISEELEAFPETYVKLAGGAYCLRKHLHKQPKGRRFSFSKTGVMADKAYCCGQWPSRRSGGADWRAAVANNGACCSEIDRPQEDQGYSLPHALA